MTIRTYAQNSRDSRHPAPVESVLLNRNKSARRCSEAEPGHRLAPGPRSTGLYPGHGVISQEPLVSVKNSRALHAPVQSKLAIGPAGDAYEQEADRVADRVLTTASGSASGISPVSVRRIQGQATHHAGFGASSVPPVVSEALAAPGRPLPQATRAFMEPRFGRDFSHVRMHVDERAARSAQALRANAYTCGSDIVFGQRRFDPDSKAGRRLLAHELTHVVQQNSGGIHHASAANGSAVIRRDPGDESESEEAEAPTLTNARFTGNWVLQRILDGRIEELSARHNGRGGAVSRVQNALVALGFELPMHRADGSYGTETVEAIRQFRARYGPSEGDVLDGATLAVLDRVAPPPGEQHQHTVDYDRLLSDRRLDVTVAIGATDERVWHETSPGDWEQTERPVEELEAERFREWMTGRGFELELFGWAGNEYWKATRSFTWTGASGVEQTQEIDVWINLVVPGTGAADEFREGLTSDEITIYSGHARYGSGPDFDAKDKAAENFRIGIDNALAAAGRRTRVEEARRHGVAVDEEHDLREMVNSGDWDPDRYRVLFFNACTSLAYLDEVRSEIGGPGNVDMVGTRRPSLFDTRESHVGIAEAQRFLQGILDGESVESIIAALDAMQREMHRENRDPFPRGGLYSSSGLGDNPRAP